MNTIQEKYEEIYSGVSRKDITTEYQKILDMLMKLTIEEREQLNIKKIKLDLLWHVSMNEFDLDFVYKFSKKLALDLTNEIDSIVKSNGNVKNIAAYIGLHHLDDDEITDLVIKAIRRVLPENEEDLSVMGSLKTYLEDTNLYEATMNKIKKTGDPETIVSAALCFENSLIKEIFENKKNMYLYLTANTFTDAEDIEYYKKRLLSMDDNELEKQLNNKALKTDIKIKKKAMNS